MQKELPNAIEISTKVLDDAVAFTSNYFQYVKKEQASRLSPAVGTGAV